MGRYGYLLKNVGLLTLSNFATKLLTFFMVPLYTSVLSTGEYGTYDLFVTTISVLLPILTLNIQSGVLRYALEKGYDRSAVVTIGFRYTLLGSAIAALGLFVVYASGLFAMDGRYALYFELLFVVQALCSFIPSYIRGTDRIADLSVSSVISSAVTIGLNILFLLVFKWGLDGYFLANIIGPLVQAVILTFRAHMLRDLHIGRKYPEETRTLVRYSIPLIANTIAWWVMSASDRYLVIFFCGIAANGIYSVASKIPAILSVLENVFNQAWTLSAVKDFDPEDKDGFFEKTYAFYSCVLTVSCSAIIVLDKVFARFLYANDFYAAWQYVPWLTMGILFFALSNYIGGFFTAVKKPKEFANTSIAGAVTNVVLNVITVPVVGPMGAAVSTAICFAEIWALRLRSSRRYIRLRINLKRDILAYALLVAQSLVLLFVRDAVPMYLALAAIFMAVCLLYTKEIKAACRKVFHRNNQKG